MHHGLKYAAAAGLVCAAWAGQAHAASYDLVLSADANALTVDSFVAGDRRIQVGVLAMDGLSETILVEQGDAISVAASILGGPLWVPASPRQTIGFEVRGPDDLQYDDTLNTSAFSAAITFYLDDAVVYDSQNGCTNCAFAAIFQSPGPAFAFDRIAFSGTFDNLTAPYAISEARFTYFLSQPVPEPATWALWLAGLGVAGAVARRSGRSAGTAAA